MPYIGRAVGQPVSQTLTAVEGEALGALLGFFLPDRTDLFAPLLLAFLFVCLQELQLSRAFNVG